MNTPQVNWLVSIVFLLFRLITLSEHLSQELKKKNTKKYNYSTKEATTYCSYSNSHEHLIFLINTVENWFARKKLFIYV